jgi:hypothetical protein
VLSLSYLEQILYGHEGFTACLRGAVRHLRASSASGRPSEESSISRNLKTFWVGVYDFPLSFSCEGLEDRSDPPGFASGTFILGGLKALGQSLKVTV